MRPKSIVYFEQIIFGTLILGAIQSYLDWDSLIEQTIAVTSHPVAFVLAIQIFVILVIVTLTLLVSRRRNKIAMWVSIAMFALGLPTFLGLIASGLWFGSVAIPALQTVGQLTAYCLLFTPSSRNWMSRNNMAA